VREARRVAWLAKRDSPDAGAPSPADRRREASVKDPGLTACSQAYSDLSRGSRAPVTEVAPLSVDFRFSSEAEVSLTGSGLLLLLQAAVPDAARDSSR
jgi:hypothetical protein